jgi:pimeloyl-ACP methyl ester carboxylesterase
MKKKFFFDLLPMKIKLNPVVFVLLASFLPLLLLSGCGASPTELWARLVTRSGPLGYVPVDLDAPPFHLAGLLKSGPPGEPLVVYLEGDGRAIIHDRASSDPTPKNAQSLDLALLDPSPSVLYLARIGQFMPAYARPVYRDYWSDKRLAPEVVNAASVAIDQAKAQVGAKSIHLVGYSGGGGLAALLAESRSDVLSLVTIAGLLDIDWWVETRGYRPLFGSLNPAANKSKISQLPQIHFYGVDDKVIPPEMSQVFASQVAFTNLKRVGVKSNHYDSWTSNWRTLLDKYVLPLRLTADHEPPPST